MNPGLYAMFLGPKGENADTLERLVLEALRDTVFWRRNFHPEDERLIPERIKRGDEFQDALGLLAQEFSGLLAKLKRDVPFFSPRYIGHMAGDQLLPAVLGYFAAMLHNPNNVSLEGSPETTTLEMDVARQLAALMGYPGTAWGHITAGGTIANIEALWVARNLKYQGLAAREAARELGLSSLSVRTCAGVETDLLAGGNEWALLNLDTEESLALRGRLIEALARETGDDVRHAAQRVDQRLRAHSLSGLGAHAFFQRYPHVEPGVVIVPVTAHYSLAKAVEVLGVGRNQMREVPVDGRFRIDMDALRAVLAECAARHVPVIELVSVLGSTEEGSVDPLHQIVELRRRCNREGLQFYHHCDAAWGGYIRTLFYTAEGQLVREPGKVMRVVHTWPRDDVFHAFLASGETDSATIDPHKLGYIPYPCGAVLFRNERVRDLISFDASYIFREQEERGRPFIGRYILEGSKPGAAAAACWLAHRVVPLHQGGHGALVAMTIQGAQDLYLKCGVDLAQELAPLGILLAPLTDPPDTNLFCFALNRAGNVSLQQMNRINEAIYEELRFREGDFIQRHEFILSSAELSFAHYGLARPAGGNSMTRSLERLGIPPEEFERVGKIRILRCSITNPWLAAARGGNPDYVSEFAAVLRAKAGRIVLGPVR